MVKSDNKSFIKKIVTATIVMCKPYCSTMVTTLSKKSYILKYLIFKKLSDDGSPYGTSLSF